MSNLEKSTVFPVTLTYGVGATKIFGSFADWLAAKAVNDSIRFEIKTSGSGWNVITSIRGMAVSYPDGFGKGRITFHGPRSLSNPRESGCHMEGRVSIQGKKCNAFTSSGLVEMPDGSLLEIALLHCCR